MKAKKLFSLILIEKEDKILLAKKKRGFGEGKWNGFGGKVEYGETVEESAIRELREESGIIADPQHLQKRCEYDFEFLDEPGLDIFNVHVFCLNTYKGEPRETEEMLPAWFLKDKIPYDEMWDDDKYWLPKFLEGKKLKGAFWFKDNKVVKHKLEKI